MDYVKGSRILRERIGRGHRPIEPEYSDAIVSQAATARIRRWIGAEPVPPLASTGRPGKLKKRRR